MAWWGGLQSCEYTLSYLIIVAFSFVVVFECEESLSWCCVSVFDFEFELCLCVEFFCLV